MYSNSSSKHLILSGSWLDGVFTNVSLRSARFIVNIDCHLLPLYFYFCFLFLPVWDVSLPYDPDNSPLTSDSQHIKLTCLPVQLDERAAACAAGGPLCLCQRPICSLTQASKGSLKSPQSNNTVTWLLFFFYTVKKRRRRFNSMRSFVQHHRFLCSVYVSVPNAHAFMYVRVHVQTRARDKV